MQAAPAEPRTVPGAAAVSAATPERFIIEFWPSIAWMLPGKLLGAFCLAVPRWGFGHVLTLRNLALLLLGPAAALLFLLNRAPFIMRRYRLTNRQVSIRQGVQRVEVASLAHDQYDAIDVEQGWGQAWYPAADLVFRKEGKEVFRLDACGYPESVKATIWKARNACLWVERDSKR